MESTQNGGMGRTILVTTALLMVLPGCKSPREKHEAAARANVERLPQFAALAAGAPAATEGSAAGLASLSDFSVKYLHSNAMLTHLEELENPTVRWKLPLRVNLRSPATDVAHALGFVRAVEAAQLDERYDPACPDDSPDWQRLAELKYLLIVRTLSAKAAELTGHDTFKKGAWMGEVLVYDFASQRLLGGFPLTGSHHSRVQTTLGRDEQNLAADLLLAVRGNFNAELRKYIPAVGAHGEIN